MVLKWEIVHCYNNYNNNYMIIVIIIMLVFLPTMFTCTVVTQLGLFVAQYAHHQPCNLRAEIAFLFMARFKCDSHVPRCPHS